LSDDAYRVEYPMNVVLTNCMFRCTKCEGWFPASYFGLRMDGADIVRNQPQCKACRFPPLREIK